MSKRIKIEDLALARKAQVARVLKVGTWTIDRWIKNGQFPRPLYLTPGSPARWRLTDIDAWLETRKRARGRKPILRGIIRQQMEP